MLNSSKLLILLLLCRWGTIRDRGWLDTDNPLKNLGFITLLLISGFKRITCVIFIYLFASIALLLTRRYLLKDCLDFPFDVSHLYCLETVRCRSSSGQHRRRQQDCSYFLRRSNCDLRIGFVLPQWLASMSMRDYDSWSKNWCPTNSGIRARCLIMRNVFMISLFP